MPTATPHAQRSTPVTPGRGARAGWRARGLLAVAGLTVVGGGCLGHTGGGTVPAGAEVVSVFHMAFRPRVVEVRVGQPVSWRFEDQQVEHNVDGRDGGFLSPDKDSGVWTHVFTTPGTYSYFCSIHPYMTGAVVVLPATTATTG